MKQLKRLGLATATAFVMACALSGSASATAIEPANTAFTLTSTNVSFTVHGGSQPVVFSCGHSVITATTEGSGAVTWGTFIATTLTYDGCVQSGFLPTTITPSETCHTPALRPRLDVMSGSAATAAVTLTLPVGCNIDISVSTLNCTLTITGRQTIGNGTSGTGGIDWTNLSPHSTVHFDTADIPSVGSLGFTGCPTAGVHTGTLGGDYTVAGATNVTATP